jgi:hypothetical protein
MTPFKQQREVARHHHPHARPAFALSWDMTPLFSRERRSFHRKLDRKTAKNHSQSFALLSFKQNIFNQVGQGQSATLSDLVQTTDICKEIISNNETTFCCLCLVQLGALSRSIIG